MSGGSNLADAIRSAFVNTGTIDRGNVVDGLAAVARGLVAIADAGHTIAASLEQVAEAVGEVAGQHAIEAAFRSDGSSDRATTNTADALRGIGEAIIVGCNKIDRLAKAVGRSG